VGQIIYKMVYFYTIFLNNSNDKMPHCGDDDRDFSMKMRSELIQVIFIINMACILL